MDTVCNVLCIKWGTKYPAEYVNKLHSMVERHLSLPHRFVCLTDDATDINPQVECIPLLTEHLTGWWHKLSIFQSDVHDLTGPTVFLDLDVVITDSIDFLFTDRPELDFIGVCDFIFPDREYNTSVFRYEMGSHPEIFERFQTELKLRSDGNYYTRNGVAYIGDQPWITHCVHPDGQHTGYSYDSSKIVSYKRKVMHGGLKPGVAIVVFHGNPNPHECPDTWIEKHWQ